MNFFPMFGTPKKRVKCIDDSDSTGDLKTGTIYTVDKDTGSHYYIIEAASTMWRKDRFVDVSSDDTPTTPPPKPKSLECPCGIIRADCTYHR